MGKGFIVLIVDEFVGHHTNGLKGPAYQTYLLIDVPCTKHISQQAFAKMCEIRVSLRFYRWRPQGVISRANILPRLHIRSADLIGHERLVSSLLQSLVSSMPCNKSTYYGIGMSYEKSDRRLYCHSCHCT